MFRIQDSVSPVPAPPEPTPVSSPVAPTAQRPQLWIAIAALGFAVCSISLSALLVRFSEREISAYATAFDRFWITTLVMGGWSGLRLWRDRQLARPDDAAPPQPNPLGLSNPSPSRLSQSGLLLAAGTCLAADLLLWAWSLTQTSVANATLLANLTPVFACMASWLLWNKCFDQRFLLGIAIATGGTCVLGLEDWHLAAFRLQGDLAALLAALCFSIYLLILERLQTNLRLDTIVLWSSAIAGILTVPFVFLSHAPFLPVSWQGWTAVIALALVCQVVGQGLLVYSLNRLSAEFVAIVLLLDPLLAALGAWMFFSERLSLLGWTAFLVILLGIYLASVSQSAIKSEAADSQAPPSSELEVYGS